MSCVSHTDVPVRALVRYVRREIRSLTDDDRESFLDALHTVYTLDEAEVRFSWCLALYAAPSHGVCIHNGETIGVSHSGKTRGVSRRYPLRSLVKIKTKYLTPRFCFPLSQGQARYGSRYHDIAWFVRKHLYGAADRECDHWHDDAGKR
jgi:hypothetical protein